MRAREIHPARVLIVDDDPAARRTLGDTLSRAGYALLTADTCAEALRLASGEEPALAILDLILPDGNGIALLDRLRAAWPALPAIVVTAYVEPRSIVEAMRRGAFDYLGKPADPEVLLSTCRAALARRPAPATALGEVSELPLVGASPATAELREALGRLARTRVTGVLIVGEPGVGKGWLARALHAASHRRQAPCLPYACAEAWEPILALLGTPGAVGAGLLAAAHGGTVVLDDVEQLPRDAQMAVLEWMERQRGTVTPLLAGLTTATEPDGGPLTAWLGRARLEVPPLAERPGDVLPLARHFLREAGRALGRSFVGFSPDAEQKLLAHAWSGNVRELKKTIARIARALPGGLIRAEHLPLASGGPLLPWMPAGEPRPLREVEDAYIDYVLGRAGGNKTRAAQALGIARETLRSRMLSRGVAAPRSA